MIGTSHKFDIVQLGGGGGAKCTHTHTHEQIIFDILCQVKTDNLQMSSTIAQMQQRRQQCTKGKYKIFHHQNRAVWVISQNVILHCGIDKKVSIIWSWGQRRRCSRKIQYTYTEKVRYDEKSCLHKKNCKYLCVQWWWWWWWWQQSAIMISSKNFVRRCCCVRTSFFKSYLLCHCKLLVAICLWNICERHLYVKFV